MSELHSMTGFGLGQRRDAGVEVRADLRSVNGRFLHVVIKGGGLSGAQEHALEQMIKKQLHRGSVTLRLTITPMDAEAVGLVDENLVRAYQKTFRRLGLDEAAIAQLPGVVVRGGGPMDASVWAVVEGATREALDALVAMRRQEGRAVGKVLGQICTEMTAGRDAVIAGIEGVLESYRNRLEQRLAQLLGDGEAAVDPELVARELAVVAERADVREELDRLAMHLGRAADLLQSGGAVGRKLEFLAQEMHREVNTLGAKNIDGAVSGVVVRLKHSLEQLKEQLANLE